MKRMLLMMGTMSSLIVFIFVATYVPGFGEENAPVMEKKVKIKLVFTEDGGWEPEDRGTGNIPENEPNKWVKVSETSDLPDGMDPGEILFNETFKIYKKNPCTVCGPSGCYVKQNC